MTPPDDKDEARLIAAVKRAAALVADGGLTPDAAIEKVARDEKFGPGMINVLCQGYNTGRQLEQMRDSKTATDKFAGFALANPAAVIARVFAGNPGATKEAYDAPPSAVLARRQAEKDGRRTGLTKAASGPVALVDAKPGPVGTPDAGAAQKRAYARHERAKRAFEEARRLASKAEDDLRSHVGKLASDLVGGPPLAVVEAVCRNRYGDAVTPLFDLVGALPQFRREKRAGDDLAVIREEVDFRRAPYKTVEACVLAAQSVARTRLCRDQSYQEAVKAAEACGLPFPAGLAATSGGAKASRRQPSSAPAKEAASKEAEDGADAAPDRSLLKEGFLTSPAFGIAAGNAIGKIVGDVPKTKADMIEDQWLELEDPAHHNELRKVRAHAMLNSMMTDPDDPISGFEPDQVVTAFNEISQLAPRVAEQPAVMRPLLQRRLQGNVQPFEAKEIADIEKGIATTRARTPSGSLLQNAPDSLLG